MCITVRNKLYIFNMYTGFSTVFCSVDTYNKNRSMQLAISYSINKFQYFIVKFWCVYAIQQTKTVNFICTTMNNVSQGKEFLINLKN